MNRADAEKTLASVFEAAGREPNRNGFGGTEKKDQPKRPHPAVFLVLGIIALIVLTVLLLGGCGSEKDAGKAKAAARSKAQEEAAAAIKTGVGTRDATPVCLVPEAAGDVVFGNDLAEVDASRSADGYIIVRYMGECPKVKLQITGENGVTYTFNCKGGGEQEVFPLSSGNGDYQVTVFENIEGSQYAAAFSTTLAVAITDPAGPYLYPNQYVTFDKDSDAVALAEELATPCSDDLEVVANVYNWMIANVTYDEEEAATVQSGYIPVVDDVLARRTGICLDYAALMAAMLRSQRIPTRLEVGYAGIAYHAWISTFINEIGWVNGIVEFDGQDWQLMDPTFAANSSESDLESFIGSGDSYELKYSY
ncbi:MAG: transglutaminase-like domain-containing protein [Lachnospiraceae bacterium]|nr:transglutaminase-like domain-containing protein [Lachnospiraceae bacterium]